MKLNRTQSDYYCRAIGRAVLGVVVLGAVALAAPIQKDIPKKNDGMKPAGPMGTAVARYDDATLASGGSAAGGTAEATIFDQPNDSGFGWFMKQDDVFGYGTWASQAVFANGWAPGNSVSSYSMVFFHSTSDDVNYGDATVLTELWNGDPFSIMETFCAGGNGGVNAPIAGTQATFSGLAYGSVFNLTAQLGAKVVVDCDRVWIVMTFVEGCRGAWRIEGTGGGTWNAPATVGSNNGVWLLWACEQFGGCPTATGYNSGTCCAFGPGDPTEVCDHANVDGGGNLLDPCATAAAAQITFCGDGAADYFVAIINEPGLFRGLVSSVSAATDVTASLVVVSVDAPPEVGGIPSDVISLAPEELVLERGDHNIWLEFRAGDWDPDDSGKQLAAWNFAFDASTLTSGDQGEITAYTAGGAGTCAVDADCAALLGLGGSCDPPGYYKTAQFGSGYCSYAFIDQSRPDFLYSNTLGTQGAIIVQDVSTPKIRPAGTVIIRGPDDPEPFPEEGLYSGTMTLHVPGNAKGTFTLGLLAFPQTQFVDQNSQFVPLLGTRSTNITVQVGSCCFNLQDRLTDDHGCLDILQTEDTCAKMPGLTSFEANGSCADDCPVVCGDGIIGPGEECDDGVSLNSDTEPDACRTNCNVPICGDGVIDSGETCDDGSANSDTNADACRTTCVPPICGDDARDTGEECDGSSDAQCPGACHGDCVCGVCGDGIIDPGEECDGTAGACDLGACNADCTCPLSVPTMSQWGTVILTLLLLIGARGYFGRRVGATT